MATETATVTIRKSTGYSGKHSGKSYLAKISGTDNKYVFAREFIGTEATDREEMFRVRRKGKGSWEEAAALEPGLYERSLFGEKDFLIVWRKVDETKWGNIDDDRALKMALLMDDGQSFEEARLATKPPVKEATSPEPAPVS